MATEHKNKSLFAEAPGGRVVDFRGLTILTVNVEELMSGDVARIMRAVLPALDAEFANK